jgi:hypothetical protein
MIDKRFSAEAFISVGIDTDEAQKLADLLAEEVAKELHEITNAKVIEIVEKLNSMGHSLKPEYEPKIGDISFRDNFFENEKYQCRLRLGIDTVISTGYSHLIDFD